MMLVVFLIVFITAIVLLTQYLWDRSLLRGEAARKFAHMSIGSYIATWPLYAGYEVIQLALFIALLGVFFVRATNVAPSLFDVKRFTIGDILAPIVIFLLALLEPSRMVFSIAVLHIALADGLAALVGSRFGHRHSYNIARQKKSALGTFTFYTASLFIMTIAALLHPATDTILLVRYLLVVPAVTTLFEAISPYGLDNVTVPAVVFIILSI